MTTSGEAIRHLWTHKTQDHPWLPDEELVIDRAEGVWVWTERGKKLLDGFAGLAVARDRRGHRRADRAPRLLSDDAAILEPAGRRAGGQARDAGTRRPRLLDVRGQRRRGQRARHADRSPLLARLGQARQAQGALTPGRLPRRD